FTLTDTAGLRETHDRVEAEGVKRSQKALQRADLVVYLKDLATELTQKERKNIASLQQRAATTPIVLIGTKSDIARDITDERIAYDLKISAKEGQQINALKQLMKQRALQNKHYDASSLLVRSEEHTSELQSRFDLVCRLLLEKKKKK